MANVFRTVHHEFRQKFMRRAKETQEIVRPVDYSRLILDIVDALNVTYRKNAYA
jgi:hypothetical protein